MQVVILTHLPHQCPQDKSSSQITIWPGEARFHQVDHYRFLQTGQEHVKLRKQWKKYIYHKSQVTQVRILNLYQTKIPMLQWSTQVLPAVAHVNGLVAEAGNPFLASEKPFGVKQSWQSTRF